ncbi:Uma2 family endonuclease [Catenuloplanes sp. NPDC051500]|uniref:Uma2 family endonuclease n=1 Tax=Catenuloplanes sp. NPDC051500 TaxID=3363959 RepID=UPI003798309F
MTTLHLPDVVEDGFTVDDLEGLPSGLRYEVHDGRLVIMSPARLWHQRMARRIANLLEKAGYFAETEVGVRRTPRDARVADVAVFKEVPKDLNEAWHSPAVIALAVEIWSPSSDSKDHDLRWYAEQSIATYWLVEPIDGEQFGALVTVYDLVRAESGKATYLEREKTTLERLELDGPR